jgi:peptide/nickel transport system permease protein
MQNSIISGVTGAVWQNVKRKPLILICAGILLIIASLAIFADLISDKDPIVQDISSRLQPPDSESLFGTDNFGRDIFSRVVHGSRSSLYIAMTSVIIGTVLGTLIGTLSAYKGGWVDLVSQRVIDALLGFPSLVLAIVIIVAVGASTHTVTIAIALAVIPQITRLSRSRTLSIKEEDFVQSANAIGSSPIHNLFKHILPHAIGPILSYAAGYIAVALVAESALSFLGLGVPPPYPSWGGMLQEGRLYLEAAPWITLFPGIILSLTAISFALLGDGLRDLFDPRENLSTLSDRGSGN